MLEIVKIFLTALTPIGELRAAIPYGLTALNQPVWLVFLTAIIGNIIPPLLILWLFPGVSAWLQKKSHLMAKFLDWLFARTRRRTKDKIEKYGSLALILFVAIPLPYTGAWSGALAAWLFGIPFKKAIPNIFLGIMIAGVIVTGITLGFLNFIN